MSVQMPRELLHYIERGCYRMRADDGRVSLDLHLFAGRVFRGDLDALKRASADAPPRLRKDRRCYAALILDGRLHWNGVNWPDRYGVCAEHRQAEPT